MELTFNLTPEERRVQEGINYMGGMIKNLYLNTVAQTESLKKVAHYTDKYEGENAGQFGYFIEPEPGRLLTIINKIGKYKILDLGSGAGILMKMLQCWNYEITTTGYEIEGALVEYANTKNICKTVKKDILTITPGDVKDFDILYFWEPLASQKLAEQFVANLAKVAQHGQIIIYHQSGPIGHFIRSNKIFEPIKITGSDYNGYGPFSLYIINKPKVKKNVESNK